MDISKDLKAAEIATLPAEKVKEMAAEMWKKQKRNDVIVAISAIGGMILGCVEAWIYYNITWYVDENGNRAITTEGEPRYLMAMRIVCSIFAFTAVYGTIMRYNYHLKLMKIQQVVRFAWGFRRAGLLPKIIFESLLLVVHAPPGINFRLQINQQGEVLTYSFDTIIAVFTLIRVYLIFKVLALYSHWNSQFSNEMALKYHAEGGFGFSLKAELAQRPYLSIGITFFLSIIVFGFAECALERPFIHISGQNWDNIWNGMWNVIVMVTTVGYGDFYPRTHFGRFVMTICMVVGTFLTSLTVVALTNSSQFSKGEQRSYEGLVDLRVRNIYLYKAIDVIKASYLYWRVLRGEFPSHIKPTQIYFYRKKKFEIFKNTINAFSSYRRKYMANSASVSFDLVSERCTLMVNYQTELLKLASKRLMISIHFVGDIQHKNEMAIEKANAVLKTSDKMMLQVFAKTEEMSDKYLVIMNNLGKLKSPPKHIEYLFKPVEESPTKIENKERRVLNKRAAVKFPNFENRKPQGDESSRNSDLQSNSQDFTFSKKKTIKLIETENVEEDQKLKEEPEMIMEEVFGDNVVSSDAFVPEKIKGKSLLKGEAKEKENLLSQRSSKSKQKKKGILSNTSVDSKLDILPGAMEEESGGKHSVTSLGTQANTEAPVGFQNVNPKRHEWKTEKSEVIFNPMKAALDAVLEHQTNRNGDSDRKDSRRLSGTFEYPVPESPLEESKPRRIGNRKEKHSKESRVNSKITKGQHQMKVSKQEQQYEIASNIFGSQYVQADLEEASVSK